MSAYYLKPIFWNTNNYQRPSGVQCKSGYPAESGFGHEEWNNSPNFIFEENGEHFRVFHTEGFGNQPLDDLAGDIFVFMIASHDNGQYLVGVAGGATSLISNEDERSELVELLKLQEIWKEAWAIETVKECFDNDQDSFLERWNEELDWIPNWKCPANLFLWLQEPLLLNARDISGKQKLTQMFSQHQVISRNTALNILTGINQADNADILENLKALCSTDELDAMTDITEININDNINATTKESLIQTRLRQYKFRQNLMAIWGNSCAVTGCAIPELLRASHIKPWCVSTDKQRLDPNNGLLLDANLDALFDSGLISFEDNGNMLVSNRLPQPERKRLNIPTQLRTNPNAAQQKHLDYHRNHVFK